MSELTIKEIREKYEKELDDAMGREFDKLNTQLDAVLTTLEVFKEQNIFHDIWNKEAGKRLAKLGLRVVAADESITASIAVPAKTKGKPGRKPGRPATKGNAKAKAKAGNETGNGLTATEQKYVDYIAKGEVSQGDIAKHFKVQNPSNLLSKLRDKKAINFKKDGLKKLWFTI